MRLRTVLRCAKLGCLRKSRFGRCAVCSRSTAFVVTDPRNLRESAECIWCGSISRNRHVARCILEALAQQGVSRLRDLAGAGALRVYSMAASDTFARVWGDRPHIVYSEYWDDGVSGEYRHGVLCQDVQALSFDDESFDLVVSQDVFEHVPDWRRGLAEVQRVLKVGGRHVFSVPVDPIAATTARFEEREGVLTPVLPVETHGDPVRGSIPVYTTFGRDLLDQLREAGWEASLHTSTAEDDRRWGTFASSTFVTRKV